MSNARKNPSPAGGSTAWQATAKKVGVRVGAATGVVALLGGVVVMVTMWFYGAKCTGFLLGSHRQHYYTPIYLALLLGGAVVSMDIVNGLILATYATMAIPTMISALYLAPKVNQAANIYFAKLRQKD